MSGWIKIHRSLLEWEWFDDHNVTRFFMYCILEANHKDKLYRGTMVKRGTFLTSLDRLSEKTGLSVRNIRTCIKKLKSTGELTSETTSRGTVVTIVNYSDFQDSDTLSDKQNDKQNDKQVTSERQASDKQVTTTKNDKNIRRKEESTLQAEQIYQAYPRKIAKPTAIKSITKALKTISFPELQEKVEKYADNVKGETSRFIPHPSTWFNQERYNDEIESQQSLLNPRINQSCL